MSGRFRRVGKRLGLVLMFVVPWFWREKVAGDLEKESQQAQRVLTEKVNQEGREEQSRAQREMGTTLARIELGVKSQKWEPDDDEDTQAVQEYEKKLRMEERRNWETSANADGNALKASVKQLRSLRKLVNEPDGGSAFGQEKNEFPATGEGTCGKVCVDGITSLAQSVADMMTTVPIKDPTDVMGRYDSAQAWLTKAYTDLSVQAEQDRDGAADEANMYRSLAWIFTAIGAFLAGDWKKLLAGPDAAEDEG